MGAISGAPLAIVVTVIVLALFVIGGGNSDEKAIKSLGQRSIEALPQGEWPSLYDSFTNDFRQRCTRDEFAQAGMDATSQLGNDLPFLKFKRLQDLLIQDRNARAVIVGQVASQAEYKIQAAFLNEDGGWKIAPAADTKGCQAFQQLHE